MQAPSALHIAILCAFAIGFLAPVRPVCAESRPSPMMGGPLGLNTVPSARMDKSGTLRLGVSTLDPYIHSTLGVQLADPLYISLRQTAEISDLFSAPKRLYPGLDFKLRILKESQSRPALAIGLQSAIGHTRMAGEYIVASKRTGNFDFTAGIGWGRFGSAGHFKNPLKSLHSHFGGRRTLDGENPSGPQNWFTGDKIGLFGGVEYFTPLEGLSLKFDAGADRYEAEKAALSYDAPAPWSLGLAYKPVPWADFSLGLQGTDKIMGRVSLQGLAQNWRSPEARPRAQTPLRPFRTELALPERMERSASNDGMVLYGAHHDLHSAQTYLQINPHRSTPRQLGEASIHMANHAGPAIESLDIIPTRLGLQGPSVHLMRTDFEHALGRKEGSAEEIWHNAAFNTQTKTPLSRPNRFAQRWAGLKNYNLILDNQMSLAEEDHGILYRTALIAEGTMPDMFGIVDTGIGLRWNIADNLGNITALRPRAFLPVRSDVDLFAQRGLAVDTLYSAFTHSFRPDLHLSLIGGYLEEMYGGLGGEVLYRPFGPRWAFGAESWLALKRDPLVPLNLGFNGDHVLTSHINGWYDIPGMGVTIKGSAGRYLAGDTGASLRLSRNFKNGVMLEGFVSVSNQGDFDLFGGSTHAEHGIRLSLPLGGYKYMPSGASIRLRAEPFGRDSAQRLQNPLPLYELTEPFSYAHITRHWPDITE